MRAVFVTTGAALLAVAGVLPFVLGGDGAPLPPAVAAPSTSPPAAPPAALAVAPPAPEAARAEPEDATWLLPDGTRVAALNGAIDPKPLAEAWPAGVPWSPILGVERSPAGIDWYVHADGSKSTTEMKWRADLGREDAVTRLARPAPLSPAIGPR